MDLLGSPRLEILRATAVFSLKNDNNIDRLSNVIQLRFSWERRLGGTVYKKSGCLFPLRDQGKNEKKENMKNVLLTNLRPKKHLIGLLALIASSLLQTGCATSGHHERKGAVAGAATGALLGAIIGNQSGEEGEGATIGAVAGAIVGREIGRSKDQADMRNARPRSTEVYDATRIDYGSMMTEDEKRRVRKRAGKDEIIDWGYYLTSDEKRRILDRADQAIGL
tara:strand:+ start:15144 stop:15812 length:669 start_codon:yes stop_codon:yes gene_type:complete